MKRLLIIGISFAVIISTLTSCAVNNTKSVAEKLQPEVLYAAYNTKPRDLKIQSKCQLPPSINIVNVETRDADYPIFEWWMDYTLTFVKPKEFMNNVVDYLKIAFEKSMVSVSAMTGAILRLKVEIPETKYTDIYEAEDWIRGGGPRAMASTIHVITQKIIEDPVIQNYILCKDEHIQTIKDQKEKDETASKSLSQKLQELQNMNRNKP